jgi:surface protein
MRGIFTGADATIEVQVRVQYDNSPWQTGWTLRDSTGTLISSQAFASFTTRGGTITKTSSVALGTYTFEMTDSAGDGIGLGGGSFRITVNGETVVSNNGQFNSIVQETFEVQAPTPSRFLSFETTDELGGAVDSYLADNSTSTLLARTYGWPIGIWDVSKIQDFSAIFSANSFGSSHGFNSAAATFNEDISGWEMSSATNMTGMFNGATSFDQPIGSWNVSSVRDMIFMFSRATSFDQPIGDWNVSSVTTMRGMFRQATSFNQPLADWNVSSVTDMAFMFDGATSFDQPLGNWNVSSVTSMGFMFDGAKSFNQPIGNWNVSSVTSMNFMFSFATSFTQSLGNWNVQDETELTFIFRESGCPVVDGEKSCF